MELETVIHEEELLWFEKSREQWLKFGDKNTKYFHATTLIMRQRNKIICIKGDDGNWLWNQDEMKELALQYFQQLFCHDNTVNNSGFIPCSFPSWK